MRRRSHAVAQRSPLKTQTLDTPSLALFGACARAVQRRERSRAIVASVTEPAVRLHVERQGEGPALVLAHGFGGSARNFRLQLRALAPHATAVAYDGRGHARSEAPPDAAAYTFERLVDDFERVASEAGER